LTAHEPEINQDREFQLQILEYQREYDTLNTIFGVLIGISFSLAITIGAISYTSIAQSLRIYLLEISLGALAVFAGSTGYLVYYHRRVLPRKLEEIRRNFVRQR
jgi:high-affinity Fe2+/Pb2+ permease